MMKNETITRKCRRCKATFVSYRDEDKQYDHEYAGFCSYTCDTATTDSLNAYDRYYKP